MLGRKRHSHITSTRGKQCIPRWKNDALFKKSGSTIIAIDAPAMDYKVEEFNVHNMPLLML
jgi:hypothetical protein